MTRDDLVNTLCEEMGVSPGAVLASPIPMMGLIRVLEICGVLEAPEVVEESPIIVPGQVGQ